MPSVSRSGRLQMPDELRELLGELDEWQDDNSRDARRDAIQFWVFKIPAILSAATAGLWAYLDLPAVSVVFGCVASVCVIADGVHPRGMLRNIHLRSCHDIAMLRTRIADEWRARDRSLDDEDVFKAIATNATEERQRIAAYIRDAETALNPDHSG